MRLVWQPCECKERCLRPVAISAETEEDAPWEITMHLRGDDQGNPLFDLLIKTKMMTVDGAIALLIRYNPQPLFDALEKYDQRVYGMNDIEILQHLSFLGVTPVLYEGFKRVRRMMFL